jgi:DNA mismatch endonuclease, patch repair protein
MRANPWRDTGPERRLRSALHARGYRFRANPWVAVAGVRIRPDVVFTRRRLLVFVDGCFWHSCPKHGNSPRANAGYWLPKLKRVVTRDRRAGLLLARAGWAVVRIWEHVQLDEAVREVEEAIREIDAAAAPPPLVR